MKEAEKRRLAEIARAFGEDDQRTILTQMKTEYIQDELTRRESVSQNILSAVCDFVYQTKVETLNDAEMVIKTLRKILEGRA